MSMTQPIIQTAIPNSGDTVQMLNSDNDSGLVINPTTNLATVTIALPTLPHSAQTILIVSSKEITNVTFSGGTLSSTPNTLKAKQPMMFVYEDTSATWWLTANGSDTTLINTVASLYRGKPFNVTTTSGSVVVYLTDTGLITGNALFSSIDYVHLDFLNNDPNFGKSYTLSGVTLTISAVKQAFSGITLLSTNVLGSVTIAAAVTGTQLSCLVVGKLN